MAMTENQRWTIINALHTAAAAYDDDAKKDALGERTCQQFATQAKEAREVAALIENGQLQTDQADRANTFVRWTPEEEARLSASFDTGKTSAELAQIHNRSRAAIEARLLKLGKIDVSSLTVQLRYTPKTDFDNGLPKR
jgi:hypothetical protein